MDGVGIMDIQETRDSLKAKFEKFYAERDWDMTLKQAIRVCRYVLELHETHFGHPPRSIMDIGGGKGHHAAGFAMLLPDAEVVNADIACSAVSGAEGLYGCPNMRSVQYDVLERWQGRRFDLIFAKALSPFNLKRYPQEITHLAQFNIYKALSHSGMAAIMERTDFSGDETKWHQRTWMEIQRGYYHSGVAWDDIDIVFFGAKGDVCKRLNVTDFIHSERRMHYIAKLVKDRQMTEIPY